MFLPFPGNTIICTIILIENTVIWCFEKKKTVMHGCQPKHSHGSIFFCYNIITAYSQPYKQHIVGDHIGMEPHWIKKKHPWDKKKPSLQCCNRQPYFLASIGYLHRSPTTLDFAWLLLSENKSGNSFSHQLLQIWKKHQLHSCHPQHETSIIFPKMAFSF